MGGVVGDARTHAHLSTGSPRSGMPRVPPRRAPLTFARSTSVLAWSFSFRCSIFTLLNLRRQRGARSRSATPPRSSPPTPQPAPRHAAPSSSPQEQPRPLHPRPRQPRCATMSPPGFEPMHTAAEGERSSPAGRLTSELCRDRAGQRQNNSRFNTTTKSRETAARARPPPRWTPTPAGHPTVEPPLPKVGSTQGSCSPMRVKPDGHIKAHGSGTPGVTPASPTGTQWGWGQGDRDPLAPNPGAQKGRKRPALLGEPRRG